MRVCFQSNLSMLLLGIMLQISPARAYGSAQPDDQTGDQTGKQAGDQADRRQSDRQSDRLTTLIEQLASEHWLDRDLATREISISSEEFPLSTLEHALSNPDLTLEQAHRLRSICIDRFANSPKGGLGVSFGEVVVGAIEVIPVKANDDFPASKILNPGDRIAMVGSSVLTSSGDLRLQILSRTPNELLPALILRAGQYIERDLPLGAYDQLTGAAMLDPPTAQAALALRWNRLGLTTSHRETIGNRLDAQLWLQTAMAQASPPDFNFQPNPYRDTIVTKAADNISPSLNPSRRVRGWKSLEHAGVFVRQSHTRYLQYQIRLLGAESDITNARITQIERTLNPPPQDLNANEHPSSVPTDTREQLANTLHDLRARQETLTQSLEQLETELLNIPAQASP